MASTEKPKKIGERDYMYRGHALLGDRAHGKTLYYVLIEPEYRRFRSKPAKGFTPIFFGHSLKESCARIDAIVTT